MQGGAGTVVGGTVMAGRVEAGQTLLLGPDGNGSFMNVVVKSIHVKRQAVKSIKAGQAAALALKRVKKAQVRVGQILAAPEALPKKMATVRPCPCFVLSFKAN